MTGGQGKSSIAQSGAIISHGKKAIDACVIEVLLYDEGTA